MAEQNIVDVDTIYIEPTKDGENVEDPNKKDGDENADDQGGAGGEDEGSDDGAAAGARKPKEQLIDNSKPAAQAGAKPEGGDGGSASADDGKGKVGPDGLKDVAGETPTERALRAELATTRAKLRQERKEELQLGNAPTQGAPAKHEASPEAKKVLEKYKPAEIAALREVLPALADEMGYVKAADLSQQTYAGQAQAVLDDFLTEHKEYLPENDKDGVLWNAFKQEYGLYQKPANPKDFQKIFNRIHTAIFGIKPAGDKGAITAQQQKINVASHAGASGTARTNAPAKPATPGLRLDMLKGFSDEEKEEIAGRG